MKCLEGMREGEIGGVSRLVSRQLYQSYPPTRLNICHAMRTHMQVNERRSRK